MLKGFVLVYLVTLHWKCYIDLRWYLLNICVRNNYVCIERGLRKFAVETRREFFIFFFLSLAKELSLWNKIKYLNLNIFRNRCCKPLIFQTQIIWSNRILSLKYLRSATFESKNIVFRKSEFVAKTQLLYRS